MLLIKLKNVDTDYSRLFKANDSSLSLTVHSYGTRYWVDEDGDKVLIESDRDLKLAMSLAEKKLTIFVSEKQPKKSIKPIKPRKPTTMVQSLCRDTPEDPEARAKHEALSSLSVDHQILATPYVHALLKEHGNDVGKVMASLRANPKELEQAKVPERAETQNAVWETLLGEGFRDVRRISSVLAQERNLAKARERLLELREKDIAWAKDYLAQGPDPDGLETQKALGILQDAE